MKNKKWKKGDYVLALNKNADGGKEEIPAYIEEIYPHTVLLKGWVLSIPISQIRKYEKTV